MLSQCLSFLLPPSTDPEALGADHPDYPLERWVHNNGRRKVYRALLADEERYVDELPPRRKMYEGFMCHSTYRKCAKEIIDVEIDFRRKTKKRRPDKILILGADEVGKSALCYQLQNMFTYDFEYNETRGRRYCTRRDVLRRLPAFFGKSLEPVVESLDNRDAIRDHACVTRFFAANYDMGVRENLTHEVMCAWEAAARGIVKLWRRGEIRAHYYRTRDTCEIGRQRDISDLDMVVPFFEKILEEGNLKRFRYSVQDLINTWSMRTSGVSEQEFYYKGLKYSNYEVGGNFGERHKWMKMKEYPESPRKTFEDVAGIVFMASLAGYSQRCSTYGMTQWKFEDDLEVFRNILKQTYARNVPIAVVFTKLDQFQDKLKRCPINNYPCTKDFSGDTNNTEEVLAYIKKRYMDVVQDAKDAALANPTERHMPMCDFSFELHRDERQIAFEETLNASEFGKVLGDDLSRVVSSYLFPREDFCIRTLDEDDVRRVFDRFMTEVLKNGDRGPNAAGTEHVESEETKHIQKTYRAYRETIERVRDLRDVTVDKAPGVSCLETVRQTPACCWAVLRTLC